MTDAPWIVYILRCADDTLYTGITNDLPKRLAMHSSGKGAKYVRGRTPFTLAYQETHLSKSAALKKELFIKSLSREAKLRLLIT